MTIDEAKDISVTEIAMSTRLYNCLRDEGIDCLYEIAKRKSYEYIKVHNFGDKCFDELSEIVKKFGLRFGFNDNDYDNLFPGTLRRVKLLEQRISLLESRMAEIDSAVSHIRNFHLGLMRK